MRTSRDPMADAEDYQQEAELAVLEGRCPVSMKGRFARNRKRDTARRRGRFSELTGGEPTSPKTFGLIECVIARETATGLRQLARRCSRRQQRALILSLRGFKNCEIAHQLHTNATAICRDLQHIRKILTTHSI